MLNDELLDLIDQIVEDGYRYHKVDSVTLDEIQQVGYLAAYEAIAEYMDPASKEFKLYVQAAINRYKSQARTNFQGLDEYGRSLPNIDEDSPEKLCESKELQDMVARMICKLSINEQYIIRNLYYTAVPLTLEQIANTLDVSKERIHYIKERALSKLRGILVNGQ